MEIRLEKNNCDLFRKTSSKHENCMEMRLESNKGGVFWNRKVTKYQDLAKFQFSGGGYSGTSDLDLGKKVGNLVLGGYSETEKSKCQDLAKFQFSGGGVFCMGSLYV